MRDRYRWALWLVLPFSVLLVGVFMLSLTSGASDISLLGVLKRLAMGEGLSTAERVVIVDIRLPRALMGVFVGAGLAVSGVLMQGLFRNPLADPALVGVSGGASLGAVTAIILGGFLPEGLSNFFGYHLVSVAAFLGGWVTTLALYRVSTRNGRTSVATMLLAGIAFGALSGAATGLLVYLADDQQLRDITFWGLGSLAGSTYAKLFAAAPILAISVGLSFLLGGGLNRLSLGEAAAMHMGVNVQRLKSWAILLVAAATGAAVAVSGGIGFVGIVVPHLLRLATGPDHRPLLVNSALLGASLLLGADILSRILMAPAELPIGIIMALLGAPVFLWILLKNAGRWGI